MNAVNAVDELAERIVEALSLPIGNFLWHSPDAENIKILYESIKSINEEMPTNECLKVAKIIWIKDLLLTHNSMSDIPHIKKVLEETLPVPLDKECSFYFNTLTEQEKFKDEVIRTGNKFPKTIIPIEEKEIQ